jgi:hypothetical protein
MTTMTWGRAAIVAAICLGLTAAAAIIALPQEASAQVIYACKTTTGRLYEVAAGTTCPRNEPLLSWNVAGPQGPTGPTGPQGPAGPTGPTGPTGPAGSALGAANFFCPDDLFSHSYLPNASIPGPSSLSDLDWVSARR